MNDGATPLRHPLAEPAPKATERGDYLAFRRMITPSFVRSLYVAGMLILTIAGIILVVQGIQLLEYGGRQMIIWGALALVPGNVLWRVLCEQIVILHRIHEELVALEKWTRSGRPPDRSPQQS